MTIFDKKITLPDHTKNSLCTTATAEPARRHTYDMHYIPASTNTGGNVSFSLPGKLVRKVPRTAVGMTILDFLFFSYSTLTWRSNTFTISPVLGVFRNNWRRVTAKALWADHWQNTSQSVLQLLVDWLVDRGDLSPWPSLSLTALQALQGWWNDGLAILKKEQNIFNINKLMLSYLIY